MNTIECSNAEYQVIREYYAPINVLAGWNRKINIDSLEDLIGHLYWQGFDQLALELSWLQSANDPEIEFIKVDK